MGSLLWKADLKWKFYLSLNLEKKRGLFTWPNQDDRMNMTENGEHDRKIDNDEQYLGHIHTLRFVGVKF